MLYKLWAIKTIFFFHVTWYFYSTWAVVVMVFRAWALCSLCFFIQLWFDLSFLYSYFRSFCYHKSSFFIGLEIKYLTWVLELGLCIRGFHTDRILSYALIALGVESLDFWSLNLFIQTELCLGFWSFGCVSLAFISVFTLFLLTSAFIARALRTWAFANIFFYSTAISTWAFVGWIVLLS